MKAGHRYYFLADVLEYLSSKDIHYREQKVQVRRSQRIVIQKKHEQTGKDELVTAFPLTEYSASEDDYGFTRVYLEAIFKKIKKIPDYANVSLELAELEERVYRGPQNQDRV